MQRVRKNFYCQDCKTQQIGNPYIKINQNGNLIKSVYCNTCNEWKPVQNTNIRYEERYIIINWRTWSIIDNDNENIDILVEGSNKEIIKKLCKRFNYDLNYDRYTAQLDYMQLANTLGNLNIIDVLNNL